MQLFAQSPRGSGSPVAWLRAGCVLAAAAVLLISACSNSEPPSSGTNTPPPVTVPVGFTTFPGEIWASPRSWAEMVYPGLAYFNEVDRGGHFAAWEEPELFSSEVRAAFRPLR